MIPAPAPDTPPPRGPRGGPRARRRLQRWLATALAGLAMAGLALGAARAQRLLLAGSGYDIGTGLLVGLPAAVAVLALVGLGPGRAPRRHGLALLAASLLAVLACGPMLLFITTLGALLAYDEASDGWATLQDEPWAAPLAALAASL